MTTCKNFDELAKATKQIPINSDLLAFTNLYKRFGIECKIESISEDSETNGYAVILVADDSWLETFGATKSEKITGYNGFYTSIIFDVNGMFKGQEIIE